MADALVSFSSPGQILYLFGTQDRHLRKLREVLGVQVTLRGDEIRLHGTDDQIKRGLAVFAELRQILEDEGGLPESALDEALEHHARPGRILRHDAPQPRRDQGDRDQGDVVDELLAPLPDELPDEPFEPRQPQWRTRAAPDKTGSSAALPVSPTSRTNGHHPTNGNNGQGNGQGPHRSPLVDTPPRLADRPQEPGNERPLNEVSRQESTTQSTFIAEGNGHSMGLKTAVSYGPGTGSGSVSKPASKVETSRVSFDKVRKVMPRTAGQLEYIQAILSHDLVFCEGPAGCGKTYLAVAMALDALRREEVRKIVLVRPAVEAGERLGFLPGDLLAKVNPFLLPLLDALNDMLDGEQVRRYMENDVIEIVPLAFMRGRTLNRAFIILDEGQNTTVTQMKMFLTRLGLGSKVVATGDSTQTDLASNVTSGLTDAIRRLRNISGVACVKLTGKDIVRHRLVKEIVDAYDEDGHVTHHHPKRRV